MHPSYSKCTLLEQRTEVIVNPKVRSPAAPSTGPPRTDQVTQPAACASQQPQHPTAMAPQQKTQTNTSTSLTKEKPFPNVSRNRPLSDSSHLPPGDSTVQSPQPEEPQSEGDFFQRILGMVRSLWSGDVREKVTETSEESQYESELLGRSLDAGLRVQPFGHIIEKHMRHKTGLTQSLVTGECDKQNIKLVNVGHQPTNVYISSQTFYNICDNSDTSDMHGKTFLATIHRLQSAAEKEEIIKKVMLNEKRVNRGVKNKDGSESDELLEDPTEVKNEAVVRVVILDHNNGYRLLNNQGAEFGRVEFSQSYGALEGHVMMHDLLRRQIGSEVTGKVRLQALVGSVAAEPTELHLYPLFKMVRLVL